MAERIIDRKTWHEVITDEMDWVLVEMGARKLLEECVNTQDPISFEEYKTNFNDYCHQILFNNYFPDELSFNQVITILNSYLQSRWEDYKKNG